MPSSLLLQCYIADLIEASQPPQNRYEPLKLHEKRKRGQEAGYSSQDQDPPPKRPRASSLSYTAEGEPQQRAESDTRKNNPDPIETWIQTERWPSQYFEQDSQTREDFEQDFEHDSWLEEQMEYSTQVVEYVEINGNRYPRPIKKVPTSLRRKESDTSLTGSSAQKRRESKSVPYQNTRYVTLLAAKGSYMESSDLGITDTSRTWCKTLMNSVQKVPEVSLFRDDIFEKTCRKIQDRNEARVIQDITRLVVPSAETLATYGARHLDHLIETINEGWRGSIPVEGPRPQPDYSVGFRRSAFTDKQLNKLDPLIGTVFDTSYFVATYRMYFPFLTCEVKCGTSALDIADRQNAHSMTVAVRSVVELYRAVKRERELHREILAFSISHDHSSVRIYGHYPVIEGDKTTFYRHPIHRFDFTALDGKEKWTAYKFTKDVYDVWMPLHHKRICSAIDEIASDIDFGLSQSASFAEGVELQNSQQSNAESVSELEVDDSLVGSQDNTPNTSYTQSTERQFKKPRNKRGAEQQR